MNATTPPFPDDDAGRSPAGEGADAPSGNSYANHYRQPTTADLDAAAPQLRGRELRRMNRRALLLLGLVVLLLLLVAYWLLGNGAGRATRPLPREERVTVTEAPRPVAIPRLPPALSLRQPQPIPLAAHPTPPPLPAPSAGPVAAPPTRLQHRIEGGRGAVETGVTTSPVSAIAGGASLPGNLQAGTVRPSGLTSALPLARADTLMQRGTYIRCVLETRIVSDIPGFASCLVTEPVYSFNGRRLLLPKGAKILGSYERNPVGERVAVAWDRIITPTSIDVNMASPGIDNLGGAGLSGHYDAHWGRRIGSALLISMLSDAFKYEAAEHGPRSTTITNGVVTQQPFESNTAQTVQNLAGQAVREAANRPPTVTIDQGTVVYVYVARDVDFSGVVARY